MDRRPILVSVAEQFWHRLPGGTATATERTLKALEAQVEFDLVGVAAHHRRWARSAPEVTARLPATGSVRHHRLPRPLLYEAWLRFGRPRIDRLIDLDPEASGVAWASSMIVPPTRLPVVTTIHDLDFLDHPERLTRRGRGFFPRVWEHALARSQCFVAPSQVVADTIVAAAEGRHPDTRLADRVAVVPWGVDPPACSANEAGEVVAALGVDRPFVLWVGPVSPRKNPVGAAAAMGAVDTDLVIVGPPIGHETAAQVFDALGRRVHRFPYVNDHTLSALYHQASALLFPSLAEGFGLPVLEAMAHATPVVTSSGTATEEVAAGAALIVDPNDHQSLGEALVEAVVDSPSRDRLIENGLARAAQMSWANTAKGYSEIFGSVAAEDGSRAR